MSDVRALLDDAAGPATLHPDPVGAVRTRVRRRAARRRAGVAAGATVAVAAGAVVAMPDRTPRQTVSPAASQTAATTAAAATTAPNTPADVTWRYPDAHAVPPEYRASYARLIELVKERREVFLTATLQGAAAAPGWVVTVSLGSDADPERWRAEVEAAAGDLPWTFLRCQAPTLHYDLVAQQVAAADWPSGAKLVQEQALPHAVTYSDRCVVQADLTPGGLDPRDEAYARSRWGADVRVVSKPMPN